MEIIESHRVEIAQLLKKELPLDVITMLQDAIAEGYAFADVLSLLTDSGYRVMIHPVNEDDPVTQPSDGTDVPETVAAEKSDENASALTRLKMYLQEALGLTEAVASNAGWVNTSKGIMPVVKAAEERRFTLGPMYVPDFLDAHGEWTDPDELQKALWDYVKMGDRRIRLQHNREIVAGEWVEAMTWPYPVTVPMYKTTGELIEYTYPAGTVFLGVQWEPWAWELVKNGQLRGYSIGGTTDRVLADFPDDAVAA